MASAWGMGEQSRTLQPGEQKHGHDRGLSFESGFEEMNRE